MPPKIEINIILSLIPDGIGLESAVWLFCIKLTIDILFHCINNDI